MFYTRVKGPGGMYDLKRDDAMAHNIEVFLASDRHSPPECLIVLSEFLSPAGAVGPGREILQRPPFVRLSVTFSFRTVFSALLYFLETYLPPAP